ncbi:hypothetical protein OGAPHI_002927 [Ogataea philodendri]|uniref:Uncharacterized protein n=1 Tax=Ogataea philodendri TaxID=1378263 RepID=A0A9P8T5R3_9ASCO|nr:uncharacterized protein OGAPHI_002927 [Ogataea philodendri]KAH3667278.1 hypothetical protein OGAPHI_002927 [Ogataea philodendri]
MAVRKKLDRSLENSLSTAIPDPKTTPTPLTRNRVLRISVLVSHLDDPLQPSVDSTKIPDRVVDEDLGNSTWGSRTHVRVLGAALHHRLVSHNKSESQTRSKHFGERFCSHDSSSLVQRNVRSVERVDKLFRGKIEHRGFGVFLEVQVSVRLVFQDDEVVLISQLDPQFSSRYLRFSTKLNVLSGPKSSFKGTGTPPRFAKEFRIGIKLNSSTKTVSPLSIKESNVLSIPLLPPRVIRVDQSS